MGSKKETKNEASETEIAGVRLTHPKRVLFPERGITKRRLAEYYVQVGDWILPYVKDRPVTLVRCPGGWQKKCFFQKHYDDSFPEAVRSVELVEQDQERATYFLLRDLAGLVGLVQMGVLELHPWASRADRLERPDQMTFDLDPDPGVEWPAVVAAAQQVREQLQAAGLKSFVKTSGGKGLHVVVPLARQTTWEKVYAYAQDFAEAMTAADPERYVATASKAKRRGKIFVDYLRNTRGATNVAAYSTRARAGAPVSTPLSWEELPELESAQAFNLENLPGRLVTVKNDPWEGFFEARQSLPKQGP